MFLLAISFAMLFFLRIFEKNEMRLKDWFLSFLHLLFPRLCVVCGEPLVRGEEFLCLSCLMSFPYYRLGHEGLERQLNEIMLVEGVYALYVYNRQSPYRYLVHALKYKSRREIGWMLGRMLARRFPADVKFDTVLPVPLHKKKEAKRGFNQSVAQTLVDVSNLKVESFAGIGLINSFNPFFLGRRADAFPIVMNDRRRSFPEGTGDENSYIVSADRSFSGRKCINGGAESRDSPGFMSSIDDDAEVNFFRRENGRG